MWTRFMDMCSGGDQKEDFAYIYIEAPQKEAEIIFQNRFGHNPNRVTCTCCGEDYSIDDYETLEDATGYERGCAYEYVTPSGDTKGRGDWRAATIEERRTWKGHYVERDSGDHFSFHPFMSLMDYLSSHKDVLVIRANEIAPEERIGELHQEGYVWVE